MKLLAKCMLMLGLINLIEVALAAEDSKRGIPVGPADLYPSMGLSLQYDTNVTQASSDEIDSLAIVLTPRAMLELRESVNRYSVTVGADFARYESASSDNYKNFQLIGDGNWQPTSRLGFGLTGSYIKGIDARGTTDRPEDNSPNVWDTTGLQGRVSYGRPDAQGRIELQGGLSAQRYNKDRIATLEDKDNYNLGGTFYYRLQPKTHLTLGLTSAKTSYKSNSVQDNTTFTYTVGADWFATGKTSGNVRVGFSQMNFDDSRQKDYRGAYWQVGVQWRPLTYSLVDLTTVRQTSNATGFGDYILTKSIILAWTHGWSSRLSSTLQVGYTTSDFPGARLSRTDDKTDVAVNVKYAFQRWLDITASIHASDRTSTIPNNDYDRWIFTIALVGAL